MKTQAIIAAAGSGERFGDPLPKPFVEACGVPLVVHALRALEGCRAVFSVIIAAHPDHVERMRAVVHEAGLEKSVQIVAGGAQRACSVRNALVVLDSDTEAVLIHDGARPLITADFVGAMIEAFTDMDGLIAAVAVKPTIKRVNPFDLRVEETLDRRCLWDIQTPQIFRRDVLLEAYSRDLDGATDDAALVERLGAVVKVFPGLEENIKITTPPDLVFVEAWMESRRRSMGAARTGKGCQA